MRCKICSLKHKNTKRHENWIQFQVCRICAYFLDLFFWNGNHLKEYWVDENLKNNDIGRLVSEDQFFSHFDVLPKQHKGVC